jgi:hypothetical protein
MSWCDALQTVILTRETALAYVEPPAARAPRCMPTARDRGLPAPASSIAYGDSSQQP